MESTAARQRPTTNIVAVVAGGGVLLLFFDIVVGLTFFNVLWPALLGDLAVIGALGLALIAPPRTVPWGAVVGSAASVAISVAVHHDDTFRGTPVMGSGAWPGSIELAGLGLLTVWAVRSASRTGALASVVAFATALTALIEWRNKGGHSDLMFLLCAAAWAAAVAAGWYLRVLDARQLEQAHQVRHQERLAIAREVHDVVAHHVTGIVIQAQAAQLVADRQPDAAQRALARIATAGGDALAAMRAMVGALREESTDSELVPTASLDELRAMAEWTASERGELPVHLAIDDRAAALPDTVIASVHRIAREAVTNARRHSVGASNIEIAVRCDNGTVHLLVTNDGGQVTAAPGGFGIRGMAERVAAMGGVFDAGPLPGGGWRVAADLPVAVRPEVVAT